MSLTPAQQQMVADNLGLITFTMTKRCGIQRNHPHFDDLWQEGVLGLIRAVEKFDPAKARLSTYAVIWIRQAVQRGQDGIEGKNWAAARRSGTDYQRPVSLDHTIGDGTTFGDLNLTDDVDYENVTVARIDACRTLELVNACARDDLDRAIISADHDSGSKHQVNRAIGAAFSLSPEHVRRRRLQLQRRVEAVA